MKIAQKASATILGVVYEPLFHDFSLGFRPEHSQHPAIAEILEKCRKLNINRILSVDITGLFDCSTDSITSGCSSSYNTASAIRASCG